MGPGAYRDGEGSPWVLPAVRAVEELMARDKTLDHEYLPLAGLTAFNEQAVKLVLGAPRWGSIFFFKFAVRLSFCLSLSFSVFLFFSIFLSITFSFPLTFYEQ